jgi:predicted Zn-dependent protease
VRPIKVIVALSFCLALISCAPLSLTIPTVKDERLEAFVNREARDILKVSESGEKAELYDVRLADFPRKDILGLSIGKQRIYISYRLARLAHRYERHRWLLRQTLAHEIGHDVLGGDVLLREPVAPHALGQSRRINADDLGLPGIVSFRGYSRRAELQADKKGMEYWQKLGWDCRIWVRIFQNFLEQGYQGDVDHPTVERLNQAEKLCPVQQSDN